MRGTTVLHPGRWTLRARLLAALVALTATVTLVVGVVSVERLQHSLVGRLDEQLTAFGGPAPGAAGLGRLNRRHGGDDDDVGPGRLPSQRDGRLDVLVRGGGVVSARVAEGDGTFSDVSTAAGAALGSLMDADEPRTVDLTGLGAYRVVAQTSPDGYVVVTGLPMEAVRTTVRDLVSIIAAVGLVGLLVAALAGAAIIRLSLRPLRRVTATATHVAQLPLHSGEVALSVRVPDRDTDPRTEVGQVGGALNRLLEHVADALAARQASETRVRQFVADASHELRTPLASIRGYAELTRRSREPVPPDVAHAVGRVESEAVRMTSLVEDLLLLARLDAGRPIAHDAVDLSALLVDAVSDAHAAGPRHRWDLDLPEDPVTVAGDAARLHQVLANLLANARVHTPPGTRVTARLSTGRGRAVVSVEDDGPGIPSALLPDVFERFARGDEGRTRAGGSSRPGSTGLGLAIVSAVVAAHGGTVTVSSVPGRTAFAVELPLAAAPARQPELTAGT